MNTLGLTDQVPVVQEIFTNKESMRYREVEVGYLKVILRRARIAINANNVGVYTVLELFNSLQPSFMAQEADYGQVVSFIKEKNLHTDEILSYSKYFPARAVKNLIDSGVLKDLN